MFGRQDPVTSNELSKHRHTESKASSEIPLTSLRLDVGGVPTDRLRVLHERPSIESIEVTPDQLLTSEGEYESLNGAFPHTAEALKVVRYANGTHKLQTPDGRYNITTVAKKRIEDLERIAAEVARQAASVGIIESAPETDRLGGREINAQLDEIEEMAAEADTAPQPTEGDDQDDVAEGTGLSASGIGDDLEKLLDDLRAAEELEATPLESLPAIRYYDEIPSIDSAQSVNDLSTDSPLGIFLEWGGLDPERLSSVSEERLESGLDAAADRLTAYLNSYLEVSEPVEETVTDIITDPLRGRFSVSVELDDSYLSLSIHDDVQDVETELEQRSTGFQQLVSCLLGIFARVDRRDNTDLFVIDDLGVHLHPEWKINLRNALHELTGETQIIYSTHSPFLIDNQSLDQVRVVSKSDEGTSVNTVFETDNGSQYVHDHLEPVRASLGARVSEFLFGANGIALVEGPTDKSYLRHFSRIFESEEGYPSLELDTEVMVGKGANVVVMANLLEVEEPNFVAVLDGDRGGNTAKEKMLSNDIEERKIYQISNLPNLDPQNQPEIEDLFPPQLVCEAVAANYPDAVEADELRRRVDSSGADGIVNKIIAGLKQYQGRGHIDSADFPKGEVAEYITGCIHTDWVEDPDRQETVENFSTLIEEINERIS
jgi:hypothetical protein